MSVKTLSVPANWVKTGYIYTIFTIVSNEFLYVLNFLAQRYKKKQNNSRKGEKKTIIAAKKDYSLIVYGFQATIEEYINSQNQVNSW